MGASNWNLEVMAGIESRAGACLKLHLHIDSIIFTQLCYFRGMSGER